MNLVIVCKLENKTATLSLELVNQPEYLLLFFMIIHVVCQKLENIYTKYEYFFTILHMTEQE